MGVCETTIVSNILSGRVPVVFQFLVATYKTFLMRYLSFAFEFSMVP